MTTPQRQDTTEPLVQRELATGALFPIGRQFSSEPRTDGRNSYGLTDAEDVAFSFASARVGGNFRLPSTFVTIQEGEYLRDSGQGAGFNGDKDAVIGEYRATHPLPTSLSTLPAGDPSAFAEASASAAPTPEPIVSVSSTSSEVAKVEGPAPTSIEELHPAVPAPSTEAETHVLVANDHISFLHMLVDDIERGVAGAEKAFLRAFRRVFERAA
jgi:hypothetical protein